MLFTVGIINAVVGVIFKVFPPKKINNIYGHRTRFSMKNQDTWNEAQRYSANSFMILGVFFILLGVLCNYFLKEIREETQFTVFILGTIAMIWYDEIHLRKVFNEDGTRK
ncbi:SdpI family protein [Clostridium sp.]|uniref:SdpI family protein n=1 Tax=Clostridium sp. TaxID=1506 RepID=UPI002FC6DA26